MLEQKQLTRIVGIKNVSADQSILDEYASDFSFVNPIKPEYVVKPRNAGDIEKLVNLAKEKGIPLVPVSSGAPHFRGDTVPGIGGAIVEMGRIKEYAWCCGTGGGVSDSNYITAKDE